jgi:hypothetical protein
MKHSAFLFLLLLTACTPKSINLTAQQIIDKTIFYSGANLVGNAKITFAFRDKFYRAIRENGAFELSKEYYTADSTKVREVLSNMGYQKFINNNPVKVADSLAINASNAVNSVHYFSVLPFGLNDQAVQKKLLKSVFLKGKEYYKIEITFHENGGGEDFEDVFIYWIGKENFLIEYLAYSYHTNDGGMRFRELKNQTINTGIRFINYNNYKPSDVSIQLTDLDVAFENNELKKVSEINLEAIEVQL